MQTKLILETPPPVLSRHEIVNRLRKHSLPTKTWGTGNHRTLDDLIQYMTRDMVFFRENTNGTVVIDHHAAIVIVTHRYNSQWLELYEDKQVFPNGSVLRRTNFSGIAETIRRSESLGKAVHRCLAEELNFRNPKLFTLSRDVTVEHRDPVPSEKWPGILAAYHRYIVECKITRELFKENGYVEIEDGRKIYFKWKPLEQGVFDF